MEQYKRAFIRHHKLIYSNREKRSQPLLDIFQNNPLPYEKEFSSYPDWIKRRILRRVHLWRNKREITELFSKRLKRALKSTGGSRVTGMHGGRGGSSTNVRRKNMAGRFDLDDDDNDVYNLYTEAETETEPTSEVTTEVTPTRRAKSRGRNRNGKKKSKFKGPCEPLSSEPYVHIEVVRPGKLPNVTFSSGTIVKLACGRGYGSNLPENRTAKCVRGKWKPVKPGCSIRKYLW